MLSGVEDVAVSAAAAEDAALDEWDRLAVEHRRPSSRDGFVLQVGFVVKHFLTDKELRITDIDFWGCAHDVGGHTLFTEPASNADAASDAGSDASDEGCLDDESVYAGDMIDVNDSYDRTSFCERCCIYFVPDFVTWSFSTPNDREWVDLYHPWRGCQQLNRQKSSCRRCEAHRPTGRVLWRFLKQRMAFEHAALYWYKLAHSPRNMSTHVAMVVEDLGAALASA